MRVLPYFVFAALALGQSSELKLGLARAKSNTILRARPDANAPAVYELPQGAALRTIDGQTKGTFVRVVGERGPQGWVTADSVEALFPPAPAACPESDDPGKKKSSGGQVTILDFNDLIKLQRQAERLAGMGRELSPSERLKLSNLNLGETRTGEGAAARIGGYVASKPEGPRIAGPCNEGLPDDWLFTITADAGSKEFQGIAARVSAPKRNTKWTLDQLRTVWSKQYPVLVTGVLFYDSGALVNDDSANPIPGELRRSWLWELRQVSSILVCTGGACEPGSAKGWISLDQVN